jgi:hypothetical protein
LSLAVAVVDMTAQRAAVLVDCSISLDALHLTA